MNIKRVGIDLAKQVFQVHVVGYQDKVVLRRQLRRNQLLSFFAKLSSSLIGMEACGGAHHLARELQKQGHTVELIAPQFVKPYVKRNKNDANDAEAICEAVGRPSMRFVTIKTVAIGADCTSNGGEGLRLVTLKIPHHSWPPCKSGASRFGQLFVTTLSNRRTVKKHEDF